MECGKNHGTDWIFIFNIRARLYATSEEVLAEVLYNSPSLRTRILIRHGVHNHHHHHHWQTARSSFILTKSMGLEWKILFNIRFSLHG
jgi:hypothetical protein